MSLEPLVKFPLVSNLNNVVEPFLMIKSAPLNSKFQSFDEWSLKLYQLSCFQLHQHYVLVLLQMLEY